MSLKLEVLRTGKRAFYKALDGAISISREEFWCKGSVSACGYMAVRYTAWLTTRASVGVDPSTYVIAYGRTLRVIKERVADYIADQKEGVPGPRSRYGFVGDTRLVASLEVSQLGGCGCV